MSAFSKATLFFSACAVLFINATVDPPPFPKYKVDRGSMTVSAKRDNLTDVTLYKWAGVMPDTVTDTLRFLTQRGVQFVNENTLNRFHCLEGIEKLTLRYDTMEWEVTEQHLRIWRDTLEYAYPAKRYAKLHLLTDTVMLFGTDTSIPPRTLRDIVERDQWYLFDLWHRGGVHTTSHYWFIAFHINKDGVAEHWVNCQKIIPGYGGGVKNL